MNDHLYQPKRYYVNDLYLCAWLVLNDQPILEVEILPSTSRGVFWFAATDDLYALCKVWRDGNAHSALHAYRNAHQQVVRVLAEARRAAYEAQQAEGGAA